MSKLCIVIDRVSDWSSYYPSDAVISVEDFLKADPTPEAPLQVINLCRNYKYQGKGYYCSLMAEARGDRVIPSVRVINELNDRDMYMPQLSTQKTLWSQHVDTLPQDDESHCRLLIYFGTCKEEAFRSLARQLFDLLACPILEVRFKCSGGIWRMDSLRPRSIKDLDSKQEDYFAKALEQFNRQVWPRPRRRKHVVCELAILADPEEALPPSNRQALAQFVRAGSRAGVQVEMIGKRDYSRLVKYDALFIRETTAINHHTYQFARKAEAEQMPVVDDPVSILRCSNKIFQAECLRDNDVPIPRTCLLYRDRPATLGRAGEELGFPLVLKVPDGSFSRGVEKVRGLEELKEKAGVLFKKSVLIIAQEFMYTEFDWRIGVLGGVPLFACRYYMADNHWQIYNHRAQRAGNRSGGFDTIPVEAVPAEIIQLAVKSCRLIGKGLYGVDIKQSGDRFVVIEINDNPNIDAGIEDQYLGPRLYQRVIEYFLRRVENHRYLGSA